MFLSSRRVSRRLLLAFGATLFALPGCGGGNSSIVTTTLSRAVMQSFQGQNSSLASYTLDGPPDTGKPITVKVGGTTLQQGTDYFIDPNFPNIVHINQAVPITTTVTIQYTVPATVMQQFHITSTSQTTFTLSRPVDFTEPISVYTIRIGLESANREPVSKQDYTIETSSPTAFRLNKPITPIATLYVTYTPKTP